ncbi:follistatin [Aethina tumida]|uniref:follistatin n=1 Tax=Aethina tumida TaxID=116153 RepID=UPI0021489CCD|nr:follistatin [Aethina tumida]XP_049820209.1 follistatin [Aethina tumida]XP_049820213.1 follistatin [Aethina tumida]
MNAALFVVPPPFAAKIRSSITVAVLLTYLCAYFNIAIAGTCWSTMIRNNNGRCMEILREKSTKEDCCQAASSSRSLTTAWSSSELDNGTLFFYRILGGGVPCSPCRDSCRDVECGVEKSCVIRKGVPKCICSSKCRENSNKAVRSNGGPGRGAVCGSDGRSYRNVCRLKKRACRRRTTTLTVAYNGICQSSCDRINCPSGKHCLLDQNLTPHCVNCTKKCTASAPKRRQVCGSDGLTYPSTCHLREKACRKGKAIPIAYKGACRAKATCETVKCRERQTCLTDLKSGMPRCVSCSDNCRPRHLHGPICGTNNSTYPTWCHMMNDSCQRGYVIDTLHSGKCRAKVKLGKT